MSKIVYRFPRSCSFHRDKSVLLLVQIMSGNPREEFTLEQIQDRIQKFATTYRDMCNIRGGGGGSPLQVDDSTTALRTLQTDLDSVILRGICQGYIVRREIA